MKRKTPIFQTRALSLYPRRTSGYRTTLRLKRWRPELRRAMMRVRPEYFSWSAEEQDRYGVNIPFEDRERLDQAIQGELFGHKIHSSKVTTSNIPIDKQNRLNEAILPLTGIGEDCFYLNEGLGEGKTILSFPTLRSYDEEDYHFQEEARKLDNTTYGGKPYRGALYLTWARLFVGKQFTYATLSMAAGYILASLDEVALDLVNECIPHRYTPGKAQGKTEGDLRQWDLRIDAGGQEALLEELQSQTFSYLAKRFDDLLNFWDRRQQAGVFRIDLSIPSEFHIHFVFSNKEALAAVRFRSFLRDCQAIERPAVELNQTLNEEKSKLLEFVCKKHVELLRTFDPGVSPFRRKREIMMRKDVFDDLE